MINRTLIRIKVLQVLYSFNLSGGKDPSVAESQLAFVLEKSYQLYKILVYFPYYTKKIAEKRLELEQGKRQPNEALLSYLSAIVSSPYVNKLEQEEQLRNEVDKCFVIRPELEQYIQNMLQNFFESPSGETLSQLGEGDFEGHQKFWRQVYKEYLDGVDEFYDILQDSSIFWNDDIDIVMSFVIKVVNGMQADRPLSKLIRPMYRSEDEKSFGSTLIYNAVENEQEYRQIISEYFRNWDKDRVVEMDYLILQLAITEAISFPSIATRVTINEYLNLVKYYSAPNNTSYINGILHQALSDLKQQGRVLGE